VRWKGADGVAYPRFLTKRILERTKSQFPGIKRGRVCLSNGASGERSTYRLTSGASFPPRLISGQSGRDLSTEGSLLKRVMKSSCDLGLWRAEYV
jgi:hypothetical protein